MPEEGVAPPRLSGQPGLSRPCLLFHHSGIGTQDGSRTHMSLRDPGSEPGAYAIPPPERTRPGNRTQQGLRVGQLCSPAHSPRVVMLPGIEPGRSAYQTLQVDHTIQHH